MKNVKALYLANNNLCSLPSDIAHLAMLDTLVVRLSRRSDHDLTTGPLFQVNRNQLVRAERTNHRLTLTTSASSWTPFSTTPFVVLHQRIRSTTAANETSAAQSPREAINSNFKQTCLFLCLWTLCHFFLCVWHSWSAL
jgi:hypothetical protein